MIKKAFFFFLASVLLVACSSADDKQTQSISFGTIPPQNLTIGSYQLSATASSGLPVTYGSNNSQIAYIENGTIHFVTSGTVYITANQSGNDIYHEAESVSQKLVITDKDPNKTDQTIDFELGISTWKVSQGEVLTLNATASSGLTVKFISSNEEIGTIDGNKLTLHHFTKPYEATLKITAYQEGNSTYNPAENVEQSFYVIGDVTH